MYLHRLGDLPSSADNLLTAMPTVSRADLAVQTVELAEGLDHRAEHGGRWRARMSPVTNRALRWLATLTYRNGPEAIIFEDKGGDTDGVSDSSMV